MNIRLTDNYELRRVDSLNWRLYERKAVKKKDGSRGKPTGEVLTEWVALDCFPRTVDSACAWILENGKGYTRDESLTLAQAVDEFKRTADGLKHAVERAVRNV
jgi:hypothetical protein